MKPSSLQYVPDRYIDAKTVAEILNVSVRTVRRLQTDRTLPSFRMGRLVKFRLSDIENYRDGKRRKTNK